MACPGSDSEAAFPPRLAAGEANRDAAPLPCQRLLRLSTAQPLAVKVAPGEPAQEVRGAGAAGELARFHAAAPLLALDGGLLVLAVRDAAWQPFPLSAYARSFSTGTDLDIHTHNTPSVLFPFPFPGNAFLHVRHHRPPG